MKNCSISKNFTLLIVILLMPFLVSAQNVFYKDGFMPALNIKLESSTKNDTIALFSPHSKLITYFYDSEKKELAVINQIEEGDMCSFWYHLFKLNNVTKRWENLAWKGVGVHLYRKEFVIYKFTFLNTRSLEIADDNKQKLISNVRINNDNIFEYESVKD